MRAGVHPGEADENGYTAIHAAVSWENPSILEYLIRECDGNVNIADTEGCTPLFYAETVEMAKLLVEELGADMQIKSLDENKLAHEVLEEEFADVALYLKNKMGLELGGDSNTAQLQLHYSEMDESDGTVPAATRQRIDALISAEREDGINRDDELRAIVTEAVLGNNGNAEENGRNVRQRRE